MGAESKTEELRRRAEKLRQAEPSLLASTAVRQVPGPPQVPQKDPGEESRERKAGSRTVPPLPQVTAGSGEQTEKPAVRTGRTGKGPEPPRWERATGKAMRQAQR